ncbi:hypothetical protein [Nitratireductor sp. StC3]|uniref:hypothetical protein n=1 Tax=Nitratireductor sp. StC3 TaxID=2126741 RepID=UPI000D0DBF12|nr:hypothetical protein [Nitratireductor sp. StC3]PSM19844.1 hypothetical protein C7T96_01875 [Nitratireductor sp. StC3]
MRRRYLAAAFAVAFSACSVGNQSVGAPASGPLPSDLNELVRFLAHKDATCEAKGKYGDVSCSIGNRSGTLAIIRSRDNLVIEQTIAFDAGNDTMMFFAIHLGDIVQRLGMRPAQREECTNSPLSGAVIRYTLPRFYVRCEGTARSNIHLVVWFTPK